MDSLLAAADPAEIIEDPFPHIVIRDAMDAEAYRRFASTIPTFEMIGWVGEPPNNKRYPYAASRILADPRMSPLWKEFCLRHTSTAFFHEVVDLFADHIAKMNPRLKDRVGPLKDLRTGLMNVADHSETDVLLDARLEINTPVFERPSSVRKGHLDTPNRLYSGLFYMRDPDDDADGGDLELFRWKEGKPSAIERFQIPDEELELVKTIRYEANVLVLFFNSINALHGVSSRSVTNFQRSYFFITGEVEQDQFGCRFT